MKPFQTGYDADEWIFLSKLLTSCPGKYSVNKCVEGRRVSASEECARVKTANRVDRDYGFGPRNAFVYSICIHHDSFITFFGGKILQPRSFMYFLCLNYLVKCLLFLELFCFLLHGQT
jgi:hypothetical protein